MSSLISSHKKARYKSLCWVVQASSSTLPKAGITWVSSRGWGHLLTHLFISCWCYCLALRSMWYLRSTCRVPSSAEVVHEAKHVLVDLQFCTPRLWSLQAVSLWEQHKNVDWTSSCYSKQLKGRIPNRPIISHLCWGICCKPGVLYSPPRAAENGRRRVLKLTMKATE